ncbi:hypothetical protein TeGR_g936, partial [Tetraparma gracilis]
TQFAKRAFSVMDFEGGKHETEKEVRMKLKRSKSTMLGHGKKSAKAGARWKPELVKQMVRTIHPSSNPAVADKEAAKLMGMMDKDADGSDGYVTFKEFEKAHRRLGTVLYPAFMLQKTIREKAMSKRFWNKATKKRE